MRPTGMRRFAAALVLAAVPLAACATATGGSGSGGSGGSGGSASPAPAAQPVALDRVGGIAGLRESVRVDPDGRWEHVAATRRTTGTLTADQRAELARMSADPALAVEARRPRGMSTCADGYEVSLTVGATTVRWSECARGAAGPAVAAEIARLLARSTD